MSHHHGGVSSSPPPTSQEAIRLVTLARDMLASESQTSVAVAYLDLAVAALARETDPARA